jgi:hypothetical protein
MGNAEGRGHTTAPESVDLGHAHQLLGDDRSERGYLGLYDIRTEQ